MSRKKITEVAEEYEEENESDDSSDRNQLTQRMSDDLLEQVDEFAENHDMSRNAAINFLVKHSLGDL